MASRQDIIEKAIKWEKRYCAGHGNEIRFEKDGNDKIISLQNFWGEISFNLTKRKFIKCSITDKYGSSGIDFCNALYRTGYMPKMCINEWRLRWKRLHYKIDVKHIIDTDDTWRCSVCVIPYFQEDMMEWANDILQKILHSILYYNENNHTIKKTPFGYEIKFEKKNNKADLLMAEFKKYLKGITGKWVNEKTYEVKIDERNIRVYNRPESSGTFKGNKRALTLL